MDFARTSTCLACALVLAACGDDTATSVSATDSTTAPTTLTPTSSATGGETGTTAQPTGSGSGSNSASEGTTEGPGTSSNTTSSTGGSSGTTEPLGGTTTGGPGSTGEGSSGGGSTTGPLLDMGVDQCAVKCGNTDWSYVWIANSGENTLSKIDSLIAANSGVYARIQRVG